ncbi:MAG: pyridoxamine 5'-phosphate oxidase family protein [Pseudomonadota bacterium]
MTVQRKGPWSHTQIEKFLAETRFPLRLACVGEDGYPRVVSLWFLYQEGRLYCASNRTSQLVSMLRANTRVGFELGPNEPPYYGVRGQGNASLSQEGGADMLRRLLERYLDGVNSSLAKWLLSRSADETLITVTPTRWFSWDYRQRM